MSKALATKNVAAALIGLGLVFAFAFSFATPAKADTLSDLQAQVQALLAQIATLQGGSSSSASGSACFTFTQTLTVGSKGAEVMNLQKFLNGHSAVIASTGAGSPGNETSNFGSLTKAAVAKWQAANGVTPSAGYWGAISRAAANKVCAAAGTGTTGGTTGTTPTGAGVTVTAGAQPANSLAPQGASRVPFTTFTLTNNSGAAVTISSITVQRSGLAQDAAFSGVELLDSNGVQVGISHTFNSNHQANIGDTFTLNPGQSMTYTVAGNMAANEAAYAGEVAAVSVVGVNTTVPVTGSLPITGAQQTINATLTIGAVSTSTSSFDPGANQTKNIGDTGIRFSGLRFTANSSEDLKLYNIRWRQTGTAGSQDISNIATVVNGTSYPATVDATGKYYTSTFPGGILIAKGNSIDVYVKGDITGSNAAGQTVQFNIDKVTDVYFVGQLYGYGVAPSGTYTPWFSAYKTTVQAGSATAIQNDTSVPAANVPVQINNTTLGGFQTNFVGEPVTVSGITLHVATSSGAGSGLLTSVSIVDSNGSVVAGPVDATYQDTTHQSVAFTDSVTFPVGLRSYKVIGKVPSLANGGTLTVAFTPSSDFTSPTGQVSGNTISLPSGAVTLSQMTVRTAQIVITASPNPTARTVIAGQNAVELGDVVFDAGQSGEDIRFSSMPLFLTTGGGNTSGDLNTCQLYNGTSALNTGSNVPSTLSEGNNVFTFDSPFTVAKGTQTTLMVKCNIVSGASSNYQWGVNSSNKPAPTGVQSGNTVSGSSLSMTTGNSGLQSAAASGTLTLTVDALSPSFALAAGGTQGQLMAVYNLRATNGPVNVTDIGMTLSGSATSSKATADGNASSGATDLTSVKLCGDAACTSTLGSASFVNSQTGNMTATSTLSSALTVNPGTDQKIYVVANLANIGSNQVGGIGDTVKISPLNAKGTSGSSAVNIAGSGTASGVQMFRSFPSFGTATGSTAGVNGQSQILKEFSVTANNSGNGVSIFQIPFNVSTSSTQVSNINLYVYQNGYNNGAVSGIGSGGQFGSTQCGSGCTTSAPTLTLQQSSPGTLSIPAGQTRYFVLTGNVTQTGTNNTGTVFVTIPGTGSALTGQTSGYNVATSSAAGFSTTSFVWADNASTSPASVNDVDWTNGYNVSGLPASGL